jgi:hypothetical protein
LEGIFSVFPFYGRTVSRTSRGPSPFVGAGSPPIPRFLAANGLGYRPPPIPPGYFERQVFKRRKSLTFDIFLISAVTAAAAFCLGQNDAVQVVGRPMGNLFRNSPGSACHYRIRSVIP